MSIVAKQRIVSELQKSLSSTLTVDDMNVVVDALTVLLGKFDVEALPSEKRDGETGDFLNVFLDTKRIEGRSEKTLEHYQYILENMLSDLDTPIRQITVFHLRGYLMKQKKRGISDKTLEGTRSVMCSFFGWLQKEGLLHDNPCANLAPIKCEKVVRHPYTDVELEELKDACQNDRDRAIVCFLLATGCRISEVCALNVSDVDFRSRECVVHGKGNKQRVVFFGDVAQTYLERYLNGRTTGALFVGKRSERLTPNGVRAMLNRVAADANVEHVHPHKFRRTLATNLIGHGMQIQEVAAILGHDKLDTTMKYVYLDKSSVKNAYQKYA